MKRLNDLNKSIREEEQKEDNLIEEQLGEIYKARTKLRDVCNSYRRSLRDDARIDTLKECISDSIKSLTKLEPIKSYRVDKSSAEAILLLSDFHIGVDCKNFYNTYNTRVATCRLNKLVSEVKCYCEKFNINQLNVINLGDLIHGIIHIDSRIEQQEDIIQQVMTAAELMSQTLYELQKSVNVVYRSCVDNHSRINADKKQHVEKENLNRLIDWYIAARLKDTNIKFVDDNLDIGLGRFKLQNGKIVMFAHGHQENINNIVQNWMGATKEFVDYLCIGHYHTSKLKTFNGAKVVVNGSLVGVEEYALSKRLFGNAEQSLLIFDHNNLLHINIDLQGAK